MKILFGHNFYQHPGGEDSVFKDEVAMLRKHGHEVRTYERRNAEIEKSFLLKFRQLASFRWSKRSYDDVRALIREFKPDIAHFHNTFFMMTPSVHEACHDEGVAVVQSLHNFRYVCMNALFLRDGRVCERCLPGAPLPGVIHRCYRHSFLLSALMADMIRYHWRRSAWHQHVDRFIVAAEATRAQFIRLGFPPEKIVVKPHFVDVPPWGEVPKIDGGYALYAGRLSHEKGVDVLLKAWRKVRNVPLYVVGSGPMLLQVQEIMSRSDAVNVRALGFLDDEQYEQVLSRASFLVVPSLCYENFPRVVVEAYARGVPVVASRLGSLQEIVHDRRTGALFNPGDADDLARCVAEIWAGAGHRQLGRNARALYEARYTPEINHDALMQIYTAVSRQK